MEYKGEDATEKERGGAESVEWAGLRKISQWAKMGWRAWSSNKG